MKFECSECGHLGPAAEVRPDGDDVEVVCEECGKASPLEASGASSEDEDSKGEAAGDEGEDESAGHPEPTPESASGGDELKRDDASGGEEGTDGALSDGQVAEELADASTDDDGIWGLADAVGSEEPDRSEHDLTVSENEALERLIPDEGSNRCPKCASPVGDRRHCARCGLDLQRAEKYDDGDAPWREAPPGREEAYEQARALWKTYADPEGGETELEKFVNFVREVGLYELGIRKLRFRLVEHPDDEQAVDALEELAGGMQGRIAAARSKAEADAREFNEEISRFKRGLVWVVLALWTAAAVIIGAILL